MKRPVSILLLVGAVLFAGGAISCVFAEENKTAVSEVREKTISGFIDTLDLPARTLTVRFFESEQEGYLRKKLSEVKDQSDSNETVPAPEERQTRIFLFAMDVKCMRGMVIVSPSELKAGSSVLVHYEEDADNPGVFKAFAIEMDK